MKRILYLTLALTLATSASAQTRPWVLVKPWEEGPHLGETLDDLVFIGRGETKSGGLGTSAFYWDSGGRIRLDKNDPDPKFVIGYKILSVGIDSELSAINGSLWDIGLTAGGQVAEWGDGYRLYLMGGAGTANDDHWSNTDALYGLGTVGLAKKLDAQTDWYFGLDYNGNRYVWPDAPWPFIAWRHTFDEDLWVALGLPMGGIHWQPAAKLAVDAKWDLLWDAEASVSCELVKNVKLFAQFTHSLDGYAIDGAENRRLFEEIDRVGAGIRWITKWVDASLSGGYVLNQSYQRGFDLRDTTTVADITDEPFVSLRLIGKF